MHILISIIFIFLLSCSSKYNGSHSNLVKFEEDTAFCLKKICNKQDTSKVYSLSIISSLYAYGGGGGGGGGIKSSFKKINYTAFNICMKKKGYYKDDKGIFQIPVLTCDKIK